MIDNEIVKTWNEEIHLANYVNENYRNCIEISLIENTLDLINRLQAEKEALIAGQETLQKALAEKAAEVEELKLENEELLYPKYGIQLNVEKLHREWADIRERAIKEFVERLEEYKCVLLYENPRKPLIDYGDSPTHFGVEAVCFSDIKAVEKEMVGE